MTISKFEIEAATREAAKDRAHIACIDKIKQLSEDLDAANRMIEEQKGQPHMKRLYDAEQENDHLRLNLRAAYSVGRARDKQNSKLLDDKIKLDGKLDELYGDIQQLVIDNVETTERNKQLSEELAAANRKLKFSSEWVEDCEGDFEFGLYKSKLSEVK